MNKFFTITFRISDVYTCTFRYKMYIHVYSHIIAREINVAIYVCTCIPISTYWHISQISISLLFFRQIWTKFNYDNNSVFAYL